MSAIKIMQAPDPAPVSFRVAIAASFTSEPVDDALAFWMKLLDLPVSVEFAPYDQIFQQLLDPASLLSRNRRGLNVLLVRPEDWLRALPRSRADDEQSVEETLASNTAELVGAARAMAARSEVPLALVLCPPSPAEGSRRERSRQLNRSYATIAGALGEVAGISVIAQREFELYPVAGYYDSRRDRLGHIPYTAEFFAALGTVLARRIHAHLAPPHKVVVLDCDNTLWQGVVGEDGVDGIRIPPAFVALQRFMVELAGRGILLCLCSKNVETDVMQVFEQRRDMVLRKEHLVSWRINWQPKWDNIRSLSSELNLGLDSFVFLDDSPVECAEVGLACPEVLTLQLPVPERIESFLRHVWVFDRNRVTAEDRRRTAMYRQEAERARFRREAPSIGEFLAGLGLAVRVSPPTAEQLGRVAQLTQRTNQFNFTTVRRSEAEISALADSGLECRAVEVRDRFGDYGLVGVMIFGARGEALVVDTFLLSCRVLGRGVEHRMLRELGEIARARALSQVTATALFTKKNQPARDFLQAVAHDYGTGIEGGCRYELPVEMAAAVLYRPEAAHGAEELEGARAANDAAPSVPVEPSTQLKSQRFARISDELRSPSQILAYIRATAGRKSRPEGAPPPAQPHSALESQLTDIWTEVLRTQPIGIQDNFFDLGGTSLLAVDLCARIEQQIGKDVPLTSIMEAPTVEALARLLSTEVKRDSLVLIRDGHGRTPVFLVHDGDGETMLYRNLALRLDGGHPVYGLQPHSVEGLPMAHTHIPEMAAYHIAKIRAVQPRGPYVLGGMCAGGVIAFEVARQLRDQGEEVALVALFDAADPAIAPKSWRTTQARLRRSIDVFRERSPYESSMRRAATVASKLFKKAGSLSVYLAGELFRGARDQIRIQVFRASLQRGRRPPRIIGKIPVRTAYLFAERDYRPTDPFDGELVLFRATQGSGSGADEPYVERYDDPLLGWGARATLGVRAIDVPGGHSSMLQEPHVAVLAERMQTYLDGALRELERAAARIA